MAMVVDQTVAEIESSGYSTTTTTTTAEDEHGCNWNDWSPMVDWDAISGSYDDFHDLLVESITEDNSTAALHPHPHHDPAVAIANMEAEMSGGGEDLKGLRLVHLLMAAAETLTGVNKSHDLARVILFRLKELVSPTNGSNMERLAAHFTDALLGSLQGSGGVHSKHMQNSGSHHHNHNHRDDDYRQTDVVAAFQLLQDMSPYIKFGHFTANQAILEAVAHDRRVHIVDYDIMEGIQWASLMQAFVSRKAGLPAPHLRITAVSRTGSDRRQSIGTVQETGRRLIAFAASIGQPFSFHQCRLDSDETFRPSGLKLVRGEALVFNCMLHLPHFNYRAPESVASFLSGAKVLNPRLVTLVEEELGPTGDDGGGFVTRFMDILHHYSALYDSLEAGFPMQGRARALVERVYLGPRISGSLARLYRSRDGEYCGRCWGEWMGVAGFRPHSVSFANHCQAKLLLGLFNDGYRVEELGNNRLVLGWKCRRLLSASIWTGPPQISDD